MSGGRASAASAGFDAGEGTALASHGVNGVNGYLPPELREAPGKGDRPHLVLSLCTAESDTVTFAYGSTKSTDAAPESLILAVPMITSVYERDSLARFTRTVISESTMRDVEAAVALHFGL